MTGARPTAPRSRQDLRDLDPITEFKQRLAQAAPYEPERGTAMTLATVATDGTPSARIVLLKRVDGRGFAFYTNYESRKAHELAATGRAALVFYWPTQASQVRVEGEVVRLEPAESDAYFAGRSRGSQIGAWASAQSRPLDARSTLEARVRELEARFPEGAVPRPPFWGGFLLRPSRLEFWEGAENRLHDRRVYELEGETWTMERLFP